MLAWLYGQIVQNCSQRGIVPVWIFLPMTVEDPQLDDIRTAEHAGFIVLSLVDVYKNQDIKSLRVAEWDTHPNAKAHQLIALRLHEAILERKEQILLSSSHLKPSAQ